MSLGQTFTSGFNSGSNAYSAAFQNRLREKQFKNDVFIKQKLVDSVSAVAKKNALNNDGSSNGGTSQLEKRISNQDSIMEGIQQELFNTKLSNTFSPLFINSGDISIQDTLKNIAKNPESEEVLQNLGIKKVDPITKEETKAVFDRNPNLIGQAFDWLVYDNEKDMDGLSLKEKRKVVEERLNRINDPKVLEKDKNVNGLIRLTTSDGEEVITDTESLFRGIPNSEKLTDTLTPRKSFFDDLINGDKNNQEGKEDKDLLSLKDPFNLDKFKEMTKEEFNSLSDDEKLKVDNYLSEAVNVFDALNGGRYSKIKQGFMNLDLIKKSIGMKKDGKEIENNVKSTDTYFDLPGKFINSKEVNNDKNLFQNTNAAVLNQLVKLFNPNNSYNTGKVDEAIRNLIEKKHPNSPESVKEKYFQQARQYILGNSDMEKISNSAFSVFGKSMINAFKNNKGFNSNSGWLNKVIEGKTEEEINKFGDDLKEGLGRLNNYIEGIFKGYGGGDPKLTDKTETKRIVAEYSSSIAKIIKEFYGSNVTGGEDDKAKTWLNSILDVRNPQDLFITALSITKGEISGLESLKNKSNNVYENSHIEDRIEEAQKIVDNMNIIMPTTAKSFNKEIPTKSEKGFSILDNFPNFFTSGSKEETEGSLVDYVNITVKALNSINKTDENKKTYGKIGSFYINELRNIYEKRGDLIKGSLRDKIKKILSLNIKDTGETKDTIDKQQPEKNRRAANSLDSRSF